jgi:hypothetical protein
MIGMQLPIAIMAARTRSHPETVEWIMPMSGDFCVPD